MSRITRPSQVIVRGHVRSLRALSRPGQYDRSKPGGPSCTQHAAILDRFISGTGSCDIAALLVAAVASSVAFAQGDAKQDLPAIKRDIVLHGRYLHLPVKRDAPPRQVKFMRGGLALSVFEIRLPEAGQMPDFWVFIEPPPLLEETFSFEARLPAGSKATRIHQAIGKPA